jgi:hypothetical protein
MAVMKVNPATGTLSQAELWFCVQTGTGSLSGLRALWGQVQFSQVIEGINPNI